MNRLIGGPNSHSLIPAFLLLFLLLPSAISDAAPALTLERAIALAQERDPWISGSRYRQQALQAQSTAAGSLPDPMINAGFANLPTDSFDFNQEAMTQFQVGVTQALPRGDTLQLQQKQLALLSEQHPFQRAARRAQLQAEVSGLWLDAWRARETIQLIEKDRDLFEQLVEIAQSNYANSLGGTRQQDLVRAQLEVTRLEDRLVMLQEQLEVALSRMDQWLLASDNSSLNISATGLPGELPSIISLAPEFLSATTTPDRQSIAEMLQSHPALQTIAQKLRASDTAIALAEQRYKPEWRLNASYGYRDDDPLGRERADFFSFGVAFDLPLFTNNRQDQQVLSAEATAESVRTERALLLRQMVADYSVAHARLQRLNQRQTLYQSRLLEEMSAQAESSLEAYTNDAGDFAEVVRAKIAELNARIDALAIAVERQKTIAQLNYFFASGITAEDE